MHALTEFKIEIFVGAVMSVCGLAQSEHHVYGETEQKLKKRGRKRENRLPNSS